MSLAGLKASLAKDAATVIQSDELCLAVGAAAEDVARYTVDHMEERCVWLDGGCHAVLTTSRVDIVSDISIDGDSSTWSQLGQYWTILASSFGSSASSGIASEDSRISLALGLAKLERNLLAGVQESQEAAA
jgi:ataxin-10